MFNFCEVFVGRAMVTDADRAKTCKRKLKAPWLQTKVQKMNDLPKTKFRKKAVWRFQTRNWKLSRLASENKTKQNKGAPKPQKQQLKMDLVTRRKKTKFFLREAFRLKLSKILQDSN